MTSLYNTIANHVSTALANVPGWEVSGWNLCKDRANIVLRIQSDLLYNMVIDALDNYFIRVSEPSSLLHAHIHVYQLRTAVLSYHTPDEDMFDPRHLDIYIEETT